LLPLLLMVVLVVVVVLLMMMIMIMMSNGFTLLYALLAAAWHERASAGAGAGQVPPGAVCSKGGTAAAWPG
jgi:hypothetical protein